MKLRIVRKLGFAFALGFFHSTSNATGMAVEHASSAISKLHVGVAVIEPRFARNSAAPDLLVVGPLPINITRHPRPEIKSINMELEIKQAACSSVEKHIGQLNCVSFPSQLALMDDSGSRGTYDAALAALAKQNEALPPEQKVDTFLVLEAGQVNDRQIDKWETFGIVVMQTVNFLFQNTGYVPGTYIAMGWRFYDATSMELITRFGTKVFPRYNRDVNIPKDDLPAYLAALASDPEIETRIRKDIADACQQVGYQLDMGLWNRFKDVDPWAYIRKDGY